MGRIVEMSDPETTDDRYNVAVRPRGTHAWEWRLFLSGYVDSRATSIDGLSFVAVQIVQAIEAERERCAQLHESVNQASDEERLMSDEKPSERTTDLDDAVRRIESVVQETTCLMSKFIQYRRKEIAELRPYEPSDDMSGISISVAEVAAGSPKLGDMIARNPKNHADQWLVSAQYFADNFEEIAKMTYWVSKTHVKFDAATMTREEALSMAKELLVELGSEAR